MPRNLYRQVFIICVLVCFGVEALTLGFMGATGVEAGRIFTSVLGISAFTLLNAVLVSAAVLIVLHAKVGQYISKLLDISSRSRKDKIVHLDSTTLPSNEIADLFISYERLLFALEDNQLGLGNRLLDAERNFLRAAKFSATGELTSTIVHDIRSPLSSIMGYAQLASEVLEKEGRSQTAEHVKKILRAAQHIHDLVKRMSLFARHSEDLYDGVSISECVADTGLILEHHLKLKNVSLTKPALNSNWTVWGSKQLLIQVLVNLVSNAVDAMEESREKKVTVSVNDCGDYFEIEVQDTGPGIPEEIMKQIFRPFFTTKGEGKGTGLGLASCRDIASMLGGRLLAKNDESGRGAIFKLALWKTAEAARNAGGFAKESALSAFDSAS